MRKACLFSVLCLLSCTWVLLSMCGVCAETSVPQEPVIVDLDLSGMSGTLVYAQVYNMLCDPDSYLGKIIRMAGYYNYFDDQAHGIVYHVYNDVTAERVTLFQRQIGITEDGIASQELQAYLFSEKDPVCGQKLPKVRSRVVSQDGSRRIFCGCCMGEGCECCHFTGWIEY